MRALISFYETTQMLYWGPPMECHDNGYSVAESLWFPRLYRLRENRANVMQRHNQRKCKLCSGPLKRFGSFQNRNGTTQRYRCLSCGKTQCFEKMMNRTPDVVRQYVFNLIRNGNSARDITRKAGIHTATVLAMVTEVKAIRKKNKAKRNRSKYFAHYVKQNPHMNCYQRNKRNDRLRGTVMIVLAQSARPLTVDEIYAKVLPEFPDVKKCALSYMLNRNVEYTFKQVGCDHWTYWPTELHLPHLKSKYPERDKARSIWFQKYGLRDPAVDPAIEQMLRKQADRLIEKRLEVADAVRDQLVNFAELTSVATAISKSLTK